MEVIGDHRGSDVGELPAGWRIVPLGRLVASVEYGSSAKSRPSGEVPVLRMGNLQDGKVVWDDLVYTDSKAEIGKYFLTPGDVLFNRTNTIDLVGKTSLYLGERPAIFAGYLIRIIVEKSKLDARYLNYVLNTRASKRYSAKVLSVAVGQANINGQKLKTYPIPLPPTRAEQEAIAEALSDADALIESLEQLLAKRRQIKQGAMQELLNGKKRLPGFQQVAGFRRAADGVIPKDWELVRLTSVAVLESGHTPSKRNPSYWGGTIPWVSLHDTDSLDHREISVTAQTITSEGIANSSARLLPAGTVVFSRTATVGKATVLGREMATSQDFANYICGPKVHNHFLVYLLRFMAPEWKKLMAGSIHNTVYMPVFKTLKVILPSRAEQEAIAAALFDMDVEIQSMENRLAKVRQIKQGMMQQLLTGKIRLNE